jgi:diketogulonate reductase-like aldo/keto reductase
MDHADIA